MKVTLHTPAPRITHADDTPLKVAPAAIIGVDPPRPSCVPCSGVAEKAYGHGTRMLVDRALVLRDTSTGRYHAVVTCHGKRELLDLGDAPDENTINAARAFDPSKETR